MKDQPIDHVSEILDKISSESNPLYKILKDDETIEEIDLKTLLETRTATLRLFRFEGMIAILQTNQNR